jgi:hypothetical protein
MNWIQRNFKTIIYISFLVPILTVAFVSISHVTSWYGLSNPVTWSIYLSVGIEIAALSALAAISAQMGSKVYFPFGIVTLIQFIGNIFFAYQYIDINSQAFKDWVDLVDPLVSYLGVESGDYVGHKRLLSLFSGGMLPIISLSFLHMLVKFEEDEKKKVPAPQPQVVDIDQLSIQAGKMEAQIDQEKYTPTKEELEKLEDELRKLNEQKFGSLQTETIVPQNPTEMMLTTDSDIIESIPSDDEISDWDVTLTDGLEDESDFFEDESPLYESEKKRLSYVRSHG